MNPLAKLRLFIGLPFVRKRLRDLLARIESAPIEEIRRMTDRLPQIYQDELAAMAARLRLRSAIEAAAAGNLDRFQLDMAALHGQLNRTQTLWDEESAAKAVSQVIGIALKEEGRNSSHNLDKAFDLFTAFRRHSNALVSHAFPLIVALARSGRSRRFDPDAAQAYMEYLVCKPHDSQNADSDAIAAALKTACRPERPEAEELNRLVKDLCGFPWAHEHLAKIFYVNGKFEEAEAEIEAIDSPTLDDTQERRFLAGLVRLATKKWPRAQADFQRIIDSPNASEARKRSAGVYAAKAEIHILDDQLRRGQRPDVAPVVSWRSWLTELLAALRSTKESPAGPSHQEEAHVPTGPKTDILPPVPSIISLSSMLDRRLNGPSVALRRMTRLAVKEGLADELSHELAELTLESSQAAADDLLPHPGRHEDLHVDPVSAGRWLLTQGRLTKTQSILGGIALDNGSCNEADEKVSLLGADYKIRIGNTDAAARVLWGDRDWNDSDYFDVAWELKIDLALAKQEAQQAQQRLQRPETMLLSAVSRKVRMAEALNARGQWGEACALLHHAIQLEPRSARAYLALGMVGLTMGQDFMAGECFRRVLDVEPHNIYALLGEGLADDNLPEVCPSILAREPKVDLLVVPLRRRFAASSRFDLVRALDRQFPPS